MPTNGQINPTGNDDWEIIVELSRFKLGNETQIPKLDLDVSLNSNFIAVEVAASNAQSHWVAGGFIAQQYELDEFNLSPAQHFVAINQVNLIELKQVANFEFNLIYDPPKYFQDVSITVWQYQGIETDLLLQDIAAALNNIPITATVDLTEINQKLDTLISRIETGNAIKLQEIEAKLDAICVKLDNLNCIDKPKKLSKREKYFLIN
ncbi:MAG: hypothetical protein AAGF26_14225 [Cyanobacteria bacterium P01_G01_bin.49]